MRCWRRKDSNEKFECILFKSNSIPKIIIIVALCAPLPPICRLVLAIHMLPDYNNQEIRSCKYKTRLNLIHKHTHTHSPIKCLRPNHTHIQNVQFVLSAPCKCKSTFVLTHTHHTSLQIYRFTPRANNFCVLNFKQKWRFSHFLNFKMKRKKLRL